MFQHKIKLKPSWDLPILLNYSCGRWQWKGSHPWDKAFPLTAANAFKRAFRILITLPQGRIKGEATGAIAPDPRWKGAPRDEIYLFQIKYPFEKFRDSEAIQEYNSILYSYVVLSIKGPQQELISLQFDFLPDLVIAIE